MSDILITNEIKRLKALSTKIPLIVRSNEGDWVPAFEQWETTLTGDTSSIICSQNFRTLIREYDAKNIDPTIGHFHNDNLVIHWKALIDSEDIGQVNKIYDGKLRACTWQRRYCTYYTTKNSAPWLHAALFEHEFINFVVHHINAVSSDNRKRNLHLLPKPEHDGINHPGLEERKLMFENPDLYWKKKKEEAINAFINEIFLIAIENNRNEFIGNFAKENLMLAKEILKIAKYDINLGSIIENQSSNRKINGHLQTEYLDAYETEKYVKKQKTNGIQMKLF